METARRAANRTAPPLIATSGTPNTRPRPAARWARAGVPKPSGSAPRTAADRRRLPAILLGMGLVTLMGLTTWAVASVSIWLVPAYLSLMILIFAAPGAGRAKSPATEPTAGSSDADVAPSGQEMGADRADEMGPTHPVTEPSPDILTGEAAESSTTRLDPAGPAIARPKRSRARSRKAAKATAEPAPDSSAVTWIRVGPGQFVRADASIQGPSQATADEIAPGAIPATEEPPSVTPAPELVPDANSMIDGLTTVPSATPPMTTLEVSADPIPHDPPESSPDGERMDPSTGENPPEPATEEYGIAPSAFGPETEDSLSSQSLVPVVPDLPVLPMAEPGRTTESGGTPPSRGAIPGPLGSRRQRSWARMAFLPREVANVSRGLGSHASSSLRRVGTRPGPRTAVRCSSVMDVRLRQAARRASGRTDHVQRAGAPARRRATGTEGEESPQGGGTARAAPLRLLQPPPLDDFRDRSVHDT